MNFKYTALILASIVAIGAAQSPEVKAYLTKWDAMGAMVCEKMPTDDQMKQITEQCKIEEAAKKALGDMIKTCTKVTELTPKAEASAFCGDAKTCMVKALTDGLGKMKPEQVTALNAGFEKYVGCVKAVLKV